MGIIVCISMLLGLVVLQPSPWNRSARVDHHQGFVLFSAIALTGLGFWNVLYGFFNIDGFWRWASLLSGITMVMAAAYIFVERTSDASSCYVRRIVTTLLAISFVLYAVTIVQLNFGYPVLR